MRLTRVTKQEVLHSPLCNKDSLFLLLRFCNVRIPEAVARSCSVKKLPETCSFIKKGLWHWCFSVNFAKFLSAAFLIEHLQWLLLAFAPMEISYSSIVLNEAAEAWICLVPSYGGEWWSERHIFTCLSPRVITFFIKIQMWHRTSSNSFTGWKFNENLKNDYKFNNKLLIILKMYVHYLFERFIN